MVLENHLASLREIALHMERTAHRGENFAYKMCFVQANLNFMQKLHRQLVAEDMLSKTNNDFHETNNYL